MADAALELETPASVCLGRAGRCRVPLEGDELLCDACRPVEAARIERAAAASRAAREASRPGGLASSAVYRCAVCRIELSVPRPRCEQCQAEHDEARDRERRDHEEALQTKRLEYRRRSALARVPLPFVDDLDAYRRAVRAPKFRAVGERYTLSDGGIVLLGPSGSGKTASLACGVRRLLRAATTWNDPILGVRWLDAADIALARRRHPLGQGDPPILGEAASARVLVVDEAGFEPQENALFEIVNTRYLAGRVTLLTSGASEADLVAKYGMGFVRRIVEPKGSVLEVTR